MHVVASVRIGLESLRLHPLRTLLSTLGVVIGSASLSAVLSLGDGAEMFARQRIEREGMTRVSLEAVTADLIDGHRVPRQAYPVFDTADVAAAARAVPDARVWLEISGTALATQAHDTRALLLTGRWPTGTSMPAPPVSAGRWLTDDELRGGDDKAVLSPAAARALLGTDGQDAVGRQAAIGGHAFEVVGLAAGEPESRTLSAVVPFETALRSLVPVVPERARVLHLELSRAEDTAGARLRLERLVQGRPEWEHATRVVSHGPERLEQVAQALLIMKLLLGAFASISLVVGGIGIMNVLLASVTERTREIGLRKAVGARRRDIVWQFLVEAVAIASTGAVLGVVVGLVTAFAVTAVIRARTSALLFASVTPGSVAASAGVALVVGLVFGIYPAVRAARLPPIDAILRE